MARAGEQLVNRHLAYVVISRDRYDAQIYINHRRSRASDLRRHHSIGIGDLTGATPAIALQSRARCSTVSRVPSRTRRQSRPWRRLRAVLVERTHAMAAGPMDATQSVPVARQGIIGFVARFI
jgi:hypothetical protein